MKTVSLASVLAATLLTLTVLLGSAAPAAAQEDLPPCPICDTFDLAAYEGPLADAEVIGLLRALNDEYHAWAVYGQVIADHGAVRPFTNIQRSEARHIERLLPLFEAYDVLPIPENHWPGQVPSFASVTAACAAGVEAEVVNVILYDALYASTAREDIVTVYRDLQRASQENHLPAFQRCADGGGGGARSRILLPRVRR